MSFDEDFYDWQVIKGFPPKVIWLRTGNLRTRQLAEKLTDAKVQIQTFIDDPELGVLEIL